MGDIDMELLEQWLNDQSFVNWAKQLDDHDIGKWEKYLNDNPLLWETAKAGRQIVLGISFKEISRNEDQGKASLERLMNKLDSGRQTSHKKQTNQRTKSRMYRVPKRLLIAASFVGLMLISGISYFQFFHNSEIRLATGYGEQIEHLLPDGSLVTINANSSLTYHSRNPRLVHLEGEGFFEVAKIPETNEKFRVITPDLTVNVFGTSFNVNARNDQTKVYLEEGIVTLEIDDIKEEIIRMNPGDLITYSKKQNKVKENRRNVSVLENASWKDGALIFNNTLLIDALYEIEDIYGIQFVIQTAELNEETISGGIPIKDLEVTLKTLKEIYGIQMKRTGNRYFIAGQD